MELAILLPYAKKILDEYMDKGEVKKSTLLESLAAALESLKGAGHKDIRILGRDMEAFGKCLQQVADNHGPSDGNIPKIKEGEDSGLIDNR